MKKNPLRGQICRWAGEAGIGLLQAGEDWTGQEAEGVGLLCCCFCFSAPIHDIYPS